MSDAVDYLKRGLPGLLDILQGSDVRELQLSEGDIQVRLHRSPVQLTPGDAPPVEIPQDRPIGPAIGTVRAGLVGTFYRASAPGMPPLVTKGSRVEESSLVGIIESLQVLTDVEAGCRGLVTAVLATDGQPVEYGQPLIEVELDG